MHYPTKSMARVGVATAIALAWLPLVSSARTVEVSFNPANFSPGQAIDNRYWPLIPGSNFVFTSEADDGCEVELFEVTGDTRSDFPAPYDGIVATEIHDRSWLSPECDGTYALIEKTQDWYAQDVAGNIWYFGEATESYDGDECPSDEGSWVAGADGADAGIIMLARPRPGASYRQEFSAGNAEDMGKVLRINASVDGQSGAFSGCLETKEWSPLERGAVEHKFYCPDGGGLVLINELKGKTLRVEYSGSSLPEGNYAADGVCPPM
jgi:hypothetical protein